MTRTLSLGGVALCFGLSVICPVSGVSAAKTASVPRPTAKTPAKKPAAKPTQKPAPTPSPATVKQKPKVVPPAVVSLAGAQDLQEWPAVFQVPLVQAEALPQLRSDTGSEWGIGFTAGSRSYVAALLPRVETGKKQEYTVSFKPASDAPQPQKLAFGPGQADITVMLDGKYFGRYNSTAVDKPFVWPIFGPDYVNVVRNWPMMDIPGEDQDHPHQKGLWFAHGSVNGIDFWAEGDDKGKIRETKLSREQSPHVLKISSQNNWEAPGGKIILQDERTILFWDIDNPRVIDYFVTLKASEGDVTFGDTKEGTFAIRVPKWMTIKGGSGHIETSEGSKDKEAWGKRAAWVDYYGVTPTTAPNGVAIPNGGRNEGVAILEYPTNFRFPTYWHAREYGLFAANPFGAKEFTGNSAENGSYTLKKGQSLTLAYRVLVHRGNTSEARISDIAKQFYASDKAAAQAP